MGNNCCGQPEETKIFEVNNSQQQLGNSNIFGSQNPALNATGHYSGGFGRSGSKNGGSEPLLRVSLLNSQKARDSLDMIHDHQYLSLLEDVSESELVFQVDYDVGDGAFYTGQMRSVTIKTSTTPITFIKHGKGTQTWPDGAKYEGQWKNGMAEGQGTFYHANGDVYNGNFVGDRANGHGLYQHANGQRYEGEWVDDMQEGKGIEKLEDGSIYEGQFKNGKKWGVGVYKWADQSFYNGQWVDNNIEGEGEYRWPDGRVYIGQWKENKLEGKGIYTWPDGRKYEGNYQEDKKHGYGAYYWPDGKAYEGMWDNGKQHGEAKFTNSKGRSKYGIWENGERVKWIDAKSSVLSRKADSLKKSNILSGVNQSETQSVQLGENQFHNLDKNKIF